MLMLNHIPNYIKAFGFLKGLPTFVRVHLNRRPVFSVRMSGRTIWLRNTPSDTSILFQIFVKREFETSQWSQNQLLRHAYAQQIAGGQTPVIIDAGANIGLASLWFSERFPQARVYAIEPDSDNFAFLRRNTCDNRRIVPLAGAVWDRPSHLRIGNPDAGAGALRVVEGEGGVRAYSIPEITALEANGKLFIVKIDIEGGEASLFRSNTDWASQPDLIVIELHDWLYPGKGTSRNFLRRISDLPIDFLFQGEHAFCFKTS